MTELMPRIDKESLMDMMFQYCRRQERVDAAMRVLDGVDEVERQRRPDLTVLQSVDAYLKTLHRKSKSTQETYSYKLHAFVKVMELADVNIGDLRSSVIVNYLIRTRGEGAVRRPGEESAREDLAGSETAKNQQWSPSTFNLERTVLRLFIGWAVDNGLLPHNMLNSFPPPDDTPSSTIPIAFKPSEQVRFLELARKRKRLRVRKLALAAVFLFTGLRGFEVCLLDWGHVDFEGQMIRVVRGKGGRPRTIPLLPPAEQALKTLKKHLEVAGPVRSTDPIFVNSQGPNRGGRMNKDSLSKLFREDFRSLGKPQGVSVHALRHTFATNLMWLGVNIVDIQRVLGHQSIETTKGYTQTDDFEAAQEVMRLWKPVDATGSSTTAGKKSDSQWAKSLREIAEFLTTDPEVWE